MSKKELIKETDKEKWERLVGDIIAVVAHIEDMQEDLPSDKVSFLHVNAMFEYIRRNLITSVNFVLTGDKRYLENGLCEEANNY